MLGLGFGGVDRWQVTPVGQDLYGGMAGIALFFAQLVKVTGEERYAAPAARALRSVHRYRDELLDGPTTRRPRPGGFTGEAGIAYVLASTSVLLGEPALAAPAGALLRALWPPRIRSRPFSCFRSNHEPRAGAPLDHIYLS